MISHQVPFTVDRDELMRASWTQINLDWRAYYEAFKESHGDPVFWKGRLLFADGWTYSASDFAGPEWPPPNDARLLSQMQLAYWIIRRRTVKAERDYLRRLCDNLRDIQQSRNVPLRHSVVLMDEATGKRRLERRPVDVSMIETGRLHWLELDLAECETKIEEYKALYTSLPIVPI